MDPDPIALLTPERALGRLHWRVLRRLEGRLQGDYRTLHRGAGTEFLDLRPYAWGDDVRHIDWNATARMDELLVRDFLEEREITTWLLLDRSPSMAFGPTGRTKEQVMSELATIFAQVMVSGGNRVGAVVYDGVREWTLPPGQGRHQVLLLVRHLLRPVGRGKVTDLGRLLGAAGHLIGRRSLVVLISDFISEPGWERELLRLGQRHELLAIRVVDPSEHELPDAGLLFVQDAETGDQLLVDSSHPGLRRSLRAAAEHQDIAIRRAVARARAEFTIVSTGDDLLGALTGMASRRRRGHR